MRPYPNIVWLLVDSIRTYPTDEDVRGKLPYMETFGKEAVEFTHCVTTAPSTIMSVTAMMTGLPAYFLARNYDDFRFDSRHYHSLPNVLKSHGYTSYAFLRGQETRLKFKNMMDPVPQSFWPGHLKHGLKWSNEDLSLLLDSVLECDVPRPAFLFFHFNPQTRNENKELIIDASISDRVAAAHEKLRQAGFTKDNTITILCSDHGFPDPSKGMTSEWEHKNRLSHDLVLTDDNILIPMYVQFPGCEPQTISAPISSLDLFPTLLDLAGIPEAERVKEDLDGHSLAALLSGQPNDRPLREFHRCDSRLMLQTGRATAIRGPDYKYIKFHDEHRLPTGVVATSEAEVLIDLQADPDETRSVLQSQPLSPEVASILERYRAEFRASEARAVEYQVGYLLSRSRHALRASKRKDDPRTILLMFEPNTAGFEQIGARAVRRVYPEAATTTLSLSSEHPELIGRVRCDLLLIFVQDPESEVASGLVEFGTRVSATRRLVVDCNFNTSRPHRYWHYRLRSLGERLRPVVREPSLVLGTVREGLRFVRRGFLRRIGRWDRWTVPNVDEDSKRGFDD